MIWWFVILFAFIVGLVLGAFGCGREFRETLRNPKHFWEYSYGVPARRCLKCRRYEADHGAGFVVVSEGRACNDANAHA